MTPSVSISSNNQVLYTENKGNFRNFDKALEILSKADISTKENQEALYQSKGADEVVTQAIEALYQTNLLNQKNLKILFALDKYKVGAETIICLSDAKILTQENLTLLHEGAPTLEDMICLKMANLLNNDNFRLLATKKLGDIDFCPIIPLSNLDILTQDVIDALVGLDFQTILSVHDELEKNGIVEEIDFKAFIMKDRKAQDAISDLIGYMTFSKETFSALLTLENSVLLAIGEILDVEQGIDLLKAAKLYTQENIEAYFKALAGSDKETLLEAMQILNDRDLLDQENLDSLFENNGADPRDIAWGLYCLNGANILRPKNRAAFLAGNAAKIKSLAQGLVDLMDAGILSQENFSNLFLTENGEYAKEIGEYLVQCHLTPQVCQGTFHVKLSNLQLNPTEVLQEWCALPQPPQTIQFLTDDGHLLPGDDASKHSAQFYLQLVENLFKEGVVFSSIHPKTGMPANADFDKHRWTIAQIGYLFGYMYDHDLIFGRILPNEFFLILAVVKSYGGTLDKQRIVVDILKIGSTPLLQDWLECEKVDGKKYYDKRREALKAISEIEEDFNSDISDKALRKKANQMIQEAITPYVEIAKAFLVGISGRLFYDLRAEFAFEISYDLQGTLDVDAILSALHINTNDPNILQKVEWLKERIFEENLIEDSTWNKQFVSRIAGKKALKNDDRIQIFISTDGSFSVQPQIGSLFIPSNPSTREEFFEKLEELMKIV